MSQSSPDDLTLAVQHYQQGRLADSAQYCQAVLAQEPHNVVALQLLSFVRFGEGRSEEAIALGRSAVAAAPGDAGNHNNLGLMLIQLGRAGEALESYDRALALKPDAVDVLLNRGNALKTLRRLEDALASVERAVAIAPHSPESHNNRGNLLRALHRSEEALASYDRALAIKPGSVEAFYNRGNALQDLKRTEEALASYDKALALNPRSPNTLYNRGNVLRDLQRLAEALVSYDQTLQLKPNHAEALINRGNVLLDLERPAQALASFDQVLAAKPAYIEALISRGIALQELRRLPEALASLDQALTVNPANAEALYNRGNMLRELGRLDDAAASYDQTLAVKPDHAQALYNRGVVRQELGRVDEAIADFDRLLEVVPDFAYASGMAWRLRQIRCDWRTYPAAVERLIADVRVHKPSIVPFGFLGFSESPADQLSCARNFINQNHPAAPVPLWKGESYRHDKIRIAYVSADFHEHAVAYLIAGLLECHDRDRFETTAISFGHDDRGPTRARIQAAVGNFIDVRGISDADVARVMRDQEIDIAVDLLGFTTFSRPGIFAWRPAPVQVNYLGYPGTMGAPYIDYILADRCVIPEDEYEFYAEKVVYLPDAYQANDNKRRIANQTPSRAESGLPDSGFVFCSFNNNYKILPPIFDVWMRLLRAVEGSVLWLLQDNEAATDNLRREVAARGVAPERIVFAPRVKLAEHLARHRLADLFLDTLPYNAHTTSSDALWAGLPVVTCRGTSFAGRVAASLLQAVGLPELITTSLADYEALALRLATNREQLTALKEKLARQRTTYPLFDTDRFRRHIERAYTTMYERHQRGEAPVSFTVNSVEE